MSYYDDGRYRNRRDRPRQDGYADDGYVDNRVVYRKRRDSDDSVVEEVTRDFPPGEYDYPRRTRVTTVREGVRRARSAGRDPYYDGGYYRRDDYAAPVARYSDRRDRDRDRDRDRYSSSSPSRSPPPRRRRKSLSEQALGALGLGKAAAAVRGARDDRDRYDDRDYDRDYDRGYARDRGRSRSRRGYRSNSRSRSRPRAKSEQRIAQVMKAALAAGAAEAFRARNDPGPWTGDKGKRILTAAITAGGVDGMVDRDPDKHAGRNIVESVLAGMATNHFINGPRSQSRGRNGRSKSRGGLKDLASAGVLAAAGKEIFDRVRSKSRGRDRSRSSSSGGSRDGAKKRSSSVSKYIDKGLAALGLDDKKSSDADRRRGGRSSRYSDEESDYSDDDRSYRSRNRSSRDVGRPRSMSAAAGPHNAVMRPRAYSASGNGDSAGRRGGSSSSSSDTDSDLPSSDEEKKERRGLIRKEVLTTGLATVATIHAAHNVIKGVEGRKKRQQQLREGKISPEEARKKRLQSTATDLATVGLAAIGIKGAIGEWKEVREFREEHKKFSEKYKRHEERRMRQRTGAGGGMNHHDSGYGDGHGDGYSNGYGHGGQGGGHDYHDGNPLDGFGGVDVDF